MKNGIFLSFLVGLCSITAFGQAIDTTHFVIRNKLALDLDGSPRAYHPNNEGIDYNANGGINRKEATQNWFQKNRGWGIAKHLSANKTHYEAYLQPNGYYVSQTTPYYPQYPESDSRRYADAEEIPYVALTSAWKARGMKNCDIVYIRNLSNGKASAAIFADYRKSSDQSAEISLALANALDIPVRKTTLGKSYDGTREVDRYDGIANHSLKIIYFKGSGNGKGKTPAEIQAMGRRLMGMP